MKQLLLAIILFPAIAFAQDNQRFYVAAGGHFPGKLNTGIGLHAATTFKITEFFETGIGLGSIKFKDVKSVYIPISVEMILSPVKNGKVAPYLVAAPGFGLYNHTENTSMSYRYAEKGGFTFFGGLGISSRRTGVKPFIAAGYSVFNFKIREHQWYVINEIVTITKKNYGGLSVRAGINF